ncbi:MAG: hypothetical protein ACE5I5_09855 [Candidatus Heimdallarchaeota archaeon]
MDLKFGAQEHWIQEKISNGRDIPMHIRQDLKLMEGKARRIESKITPDKCIKDLNN